MLSAAQMQALKTAIQADPALNSKPLTLDGAFEIKEALNLESNPVVMGWRTDASVAEIFDAIQGDKYTPVDSPPAVPGSPTIADQLTSMLYMNRLLLVQSKQLNLQNILIGRESVDASKANIRAWLRDAVIALPSGASGAAVTAGGVSGVNVLQACLRVATRAEVILAAGSATTGAVNAQIFGFQGRLTADDVKQARES